MEVVGEGGEWYNSYAVNGAQYHDFDAEFNSLVATLIFFLHPTNLFRSTMTLFTAVYGSRFVLEAPGGSCYLMGGSRVPNGITSGWDRVRVLGPREPSRGLLLRFPAFYGVYSQKRMYAQHGELWCTKSKIKHSTRILLTTSSCSLG